MQRSSFTLSPDIYLLCPASISSELNLENAANWDFAFHIINRQHQRFQCSDCVKLQTVSSGVRTFICLYKTKIYYALSIWEKAGLSFFGDWKMLSQKLGNWYILFWRPYISNVPDVQCTLSLRKTWCDKNKCIMKGVKNILKIYCHNKMATSGHLNPSRISLWMLWYNVFEVMVLFYFWTKERGKQTNFWVAVLLLNASQELVTVT